MTFNEQFFDASIRHQIDLLRFGSGVARKVNRLLDETRADLRKQVERRLGKVTGINGASLRRLRELERAIDQQRSGAWNDVTETWTRTALDVALEEPMFVAGALTSILPVELDLVQPSAATLRALATTRPFQGRLLKEWAQSAQRADLQRIHSQIRIGMVQGEGARDIAARVFGARGAMNITRAQAEAVTRTVINGVSNAAQQEFLQANSDLFDVEQFTATLDSRTTRICSSLDGKQFPVGKGPIPPIHVNCRSIRVAALNGEVIGERPFKAGTEQQMLREYGAANGLSGLGSRDDLPRGHKGAFDAFSRRRMRELTGQVPAKTTYQEWLSKQPTEIQDDILGPTRGKLFREGGLTLDRFVGREGDELTLDELRERNRDAFRRAGLGDERDAQAEREKRAKEAAREAERRAREERERRAAEERARQAELDRLRAEQERAQGGRQARDRAVRERIGRHVERFIPDATVPDDIRGAVADALEQAKPRGVTVLKVASVIESKTAEGLYFPRARGVSIKSEGLTFEGKSLPDQPGPGKVFSMGTQPNTRAKAVRNTLLHELGHHAHMHHNPRFGQDGTLRQRETAARVDQLISARWRARDREYITDYAVYDKTPENFKTSEYFSEAYAAYHAEPAWLRRVAPKAYDMVEEVLRLRRETE